MKFKAIFLTLVLAFTVFSSIGCNSSKNVAPGDKSTTSDNTQKTALIDLSKLLTKSEVEGILNTKFNEPTLKDSNNPLGQKMLMFTPTDDSINGLLQVSLIQDEGITKKVSDAGQTSKTIFDTTKKNSAGIESISGLGDDAFWEGNMLYILKSNFYITITVMSKTADKKDAATKAAKLVISRL